MASITTYYPDGRTKQTSLSNATQPADPTPAGYTTWDPAGVVTLQRALNAPEQSQLTAMDLAAATFSNQAAIITRAQAALAANATFLALPSPSNVQVVSYLQTVAKELNALIRLQLGQFDTTTGT